MTLISNALSGFEHSQKSQQSLDTLYEQFYDAIKVEMSNILPSETITVAVGTCNKKRLVKKPWWNDNLSELWNERCNREKIYCRSVGLDRQHQRHLFRLSQKAFDREVQGAKRKYWRNNRISC